MRRFESDRQLGVNGSHRTFRIGYARQIGGGPSTGESIDKLQNAGCDEIFVDRSAASGRRPELAHALAALDESSEFVVVRLYELGRSVKHLISVIVDLADRNIGFISLDDGIDTTADGGVTATLFRTLSRYEAAILAERNNQGLTAARKHGRLTGRPRLLDTDRLRLAETMYASGRYTAAEIARTFNVSRATLYRNIAELRADPDAERDRTAKSADPDRGRHR
jgi:DNA invertase Pin-like site-specific DNA recombinase